MNAISRSSLDSGATTQLGSAPHVVIIGGGFTGALQAINLLRHGAATATIVERRAHCGRGIAYSAAHRDHVLNVRAGNMSAFPDDPDHFVRWLSSRHPELASGFAPRLVYGDYLAELLAEAATASCGRLSIVEGEARDVTRGGERATVHLADGRTLAADAVVLAVGNLVPYSPAGLDETPLSDDVYAQCPWTQPIAVGLSADDTVLTIGTGLTMIDVALMLDAEGFRGKIVALSRRGLAPRAHAGAAMAPSKLKAAPRSACAHLVRCVRARADAVGWHAAVDELRPFTQAMWRDADLTQRRRFLRHLRPWWDVHRHRIAPQVAEKIARMQAEGRLEIAAGKLVSVAPDGAGTRVEWRARGVQETRALAVRRIVNCTGPQGDLLATGEPLLQSLLGRGLIRPDRLRIGVDVDELSRAVDRDGEAQPWLLALGPITRGAFWEIVAVPDIRHQTWAVARRLADQLAVDAERRGA
ncbi:putative NAD(P)/FAD-binding protein YdhS [Beijerinckiaceae bacterium RH AL1]|nr:putative NAD(P)/FAD-binding protein YdhS [Beijerinckiaceae bacterium RH CH11]VVB48046.1 putative NAD(P)/FAD-binding protein YdhS [Beijerinckiaceae bacterium RH AL8]VVC56156.1 putative NAD(P)/FAD-binding protein YdhS [Beijerinckiaceae bacterium RH AL1]